MGLKELLQEQYEVGNVHSTKELEDISFNREMLELIIHQVSPDNVEYYFRGGEKEVAAVIEHLDKELVSGSPFGYKQGGQFEEELREIRAALIELM